MFAASHENEPTMSLHPKLRQRAAQGKPVRVAWTPEQPAARSLDAAIKAGTTHIGEDSQALASHPQIDVIVECAGHPIGGLPLRRRTT